MLTGGVDGLMMDVKILAGASICAATDKSGNLLDTVFNAIFDQDGSFLVDDGLTTGVATGEWMRLYLFDIPEGSSVRILVIAVVAPESSFARAVEAAAPIIESIEFRTP